MPSAPSERTFARQVGPSRKVSLALRMLLTRGIPPLTPSKSRFRRSSVSSSQVLGRIRKRAVLDARLSFPACGNPVHHAIL